MFKKCFTAVLFAFCAVLGAAQPEKVWDYSKELPMNNAALQMRFLPEVKTPDGGSVIEIIQPVPMEKILYSPHMQFPLKTLQFF